MQGERKFVDFRCKTVKQYSMLTCKLSTRPSHTPPLPNWIPQAGYDDSINHEAMQWAITNDHEDDEESVNDKAPGMEALLDSEQLWPDKTHFLLIL